MRQPLDRVDLTALEYRSHAKGTGFSEKFMEGSPFGGNNFEDSDGEKAIKKHKNKNWKPRERVVKVTEPKPKKMLSRLGYKDIPKV